ncbi:MULTISPECIES: lipid A-modifier LpxR family protein [unclassified Undibacterium]|uniref:lipid A-modifier LpxR family protein n=1 Tax=unclassified Undibacterium TaxID=2630295 RepID=UPI002AC95409|nr:MULTISPECIES: lipid A-modifier LpxR family protein [unclassified Undibacterium]MEB0140687.1 DUF2219 family protein [Undibacterium sp. CCC2.1]MEB0173697.1 DUF2219 family protein [Undibacterium sp. CCC1.1]MEB0177671.1 DUF2219 family protein [Undibacterium sp. CCC3.4]MEB0216864.1 DUF2219 family protein [Undibacterium sp. 5I2]WPX43363.1 DUF2219 family protein [Undibacterium sp. CCC3.4]
MINAKMQQTGAYRALVALGLTLLAGAAVADDILLAPSWQEMQTVRAAGKSLWQLEIENDSLLLNRDDKFYTSGVHLQQTSLLQTALLSTEYGWRFGQDFYTASDTNLLPAQLAANDHRYAGWLYAGVFGAKTESTGRSWRWGVDIGCFGRCAGGAWSQQQLHHLLKQRLPQAWSTQYRNEAGLVLSGEWSPGRLLPMAGVDLTPRLNGRFGNIFTDAGAQLELRAGTLNSLPYQPASYVFLKGSVKAVAYNATIEGGYFNDEARSIATKKRGGELEIGYLWQRGEYGLSASVIRRANEIEQMSNAVGAQNFVRLQFFYAP